MRFRPPARVSRATVLALAAAFTLTGAGRAAARWEAIGPDGGWVVGLAFDAQGPQTLYAAVEEGGVWRSDDGGASWSAASGGLTPGTIRTLVADPATAGTLYLGRSADGVWKSVDGGGSWNPVAPTLGDWPAEVGALCFDPSSRVVWAGLHPAAGQESLYRSADGGATWSAVDLGPPPAENPKPQALTALLCAAGEIYAGADSGGVYHRAREGAPWEHSLGAGDVRSLAAGGGAVYASTRLTGLFVSRDRSATWSTLIEPPVSIPGRPGNFLILGVVAVSPDDPQVVVVSAELRHALSSTVFSVFRSTDGGRTFGDLAGGFPAVPVQSFLFVPGGSGRLFAAPIGLGVWTSDDGVLGWRSTNRGLRAAQTSAVLIDPKRPSFLLTGSQGGGISKSEDGGATWRLVPNGLGVTDPLALDPAQPATLYAYAFDDFGQRSLYRGANGGRRWILLTPSPDGYLTDFALDPARPNRLFAALEGNAGAVARSLDRGATWARTLLPCMAPLSLAVAANGPLYVAGMSACAGETFSIASVRRSDDGGRTFVERSLGLPAVTQPFHLEVDPARPSDLYLSLYDPRTSDPPAGLFLHGVYRSRDRGEHWEGIDGLTALAANPFDFAFPPQGGRVVWMATFGAGIWRSGDGGTTFRPVLIPGLPTQKVFALEFDRRRPATLYATTAGGLFRLASD